MLMCVCACVSAMLCRKHLWSPAFLSDCIKAQSEPKEKRQNENPKCRAQPWVVTTELRACDPQRLVLLLIMADGWAQNTSRSGASARISIASPLLQLLLHRFEKTPAWQRSKRYKWHKTVIMRMTTIICPTSTCSQSGALIWSIIEDSQKHTFCRISPGCICG